jgi:TolB-like protein
MPDLCHLRGIALFCLVSLVGLPALAQKEGEAGPKSLLQMKLVANNMDQQTVNTIESFITGELDNHKSLKVLAGEDIKRMLDLEAEKQAAGCDDDSSCLAEMAGALGAEFVVTGQLGKLETRLILTLSLIDVNKKEAVNRVTVKADSLDAMPEQVEKAVSQLVAPIVSGGAVQNGAQVASSGGPSILPWVLVGVGTAAAIGGGVLSVVGALQWGQFSAADDSYYSQLDTITKNDSATEDELTNLADAREELAGASDAWNGGGLYFTSAGIPLAVIGVGLVAGGVAHPLPPLAGPLQPPGVRVCHRGPGW